MAARAMWKGVLVLGEEAVPVKLYAAHQARDVGFRLLDAEALAPVRQELVDAETGDPVPSDRVRKGLQVGEGTFALLDPEDLEGLQPEASRDIGLSRFVPDEAIDDRWYDKAYWLGPDGDDEAYFALARALRDTGREGVAHWVMRNQRYHGSLRVRGDHLVLLRLRHAEELIPAGTLPQPHGRQPDEKELKLARALVEALEGEFDPNDFPETYGDRVRQLVEAKAAGKVVHLPAPKRRAKEEQDLGDALAASLKAVGRG